MKIVDGPDGKDKDRLMDEQAAYMSDTNRYCRWNPAEDGQGQMLDAQSCPDQSHGQPCRCAAGTDLEVIPPPRSAGRWML